MIPLVLIGRGGHSLACLDVILSSGKFEVVGFIDKEFSGDWEGLPQLGTDDDLENLCKKFQYFFIGIGQIKDSMIRRNIVSRLRGLNAQFPSIVSPKAHVGIGAEIGEGSIIMHGSHLGPKTKIGSFNILNTNSVVEHGVQTGDFVHVSTSAVVNGDVLIGNDVFIGSNSVIRHQLTIPQKAFIQAGVFIGGKHVW